MIRELTESNLNELIDSVAIDGIDGLLIVTDLHRAMEFRDAIIRACNDLRHGMDAGRGFPQFIVYQYPGVYQIKTERGNSITIATEISLEGHRRRYEKILVENVLWDNINTRRPGLLELLSSLLSPYYELRSAPEEWSVEYVTETNNIATTTIDPFEGYQNLHKITIKFGEEDEEARKKERKITDWTSKELDEFLESFSKGVTRCSTTP